MPRRDDWEYSPLRSQVRFHGSFARYKGYSGPIGSGKSFALAYEALVLARVNPGLLGLLGAPTFAMLRDATQASFFDILAIEEIPFHFSKSQNRVTLLDTGSQVLFRSLDDYERLRGTNLAWFGIDELTYCLPGAWTRLEGRLRHPQASRLEGFAAWTPRGFDWVYEKFLDAKCRRCKGQPIEPKCPQCKGTGKNPDYLAIFAPPAENQNLPADYYEHLKGSYDERFYKQEVLGEYLDLAGGAVYFAYSADNKRHFQYDPRLPLIWSCDFGVDPVCSVLAQIADRVPRADGAKILTNKEIRILGEICIPDSFTEESCRVFLQRTEQWIPAGRQLQVEVYGDASGARRGQTASRASDYEIIRDFFRNNPRYRLQFHNKAANPLVKDRVNAVNGMLRNAQGERRLFIDPSCQELIKDFLQVKWKRDMSGNANTGELDKGDKYRTHVSDALGYLVEMEFSLTRKEPRIRLI